MLTEVHASGRYGNEHWPVPEQAHFSFGGISKGSLDPDDVIDPRLQNRRYCEVMHGRADDDDIGAFDLADQFV